MGETKNTHKTSAEDFLKNKKRNLKIGVSFTIATVLALAILPTVLWPKWLGFVGIGPDSNKSESVERTIQNGKVISEKRTITEQEQSSKTVWDWAGLLGTVAIPIFIYQYGLNEQRRADERAKAERERADQQAEREKETAAATSRDEALEVYFDRMSDLILNNGLGKSDETDPTRDVARTRTLTILRRMGNDKERKRIVMRFLFDANLLQKLDLSDADLRGVNLSVTSLPDVVLDRADLSSADLSHAFLPRANLGSADLSHAFLLRADLGNAYLSEANLHHADLGNAYLSNANLSSADLGSANLRGANLSGANLRGTNLSNADLGSADMRGANLSGANLTGVKNITPDQIRAAKNRETAHYDPDFRTALDLAADPTIANQSATSTS